MLCMNAKLLRGAKAEANVCDKELYLFTFMPTVSPTFSRALGISKHNDV